MMRRSVFDDFSNIFRSFDNLFASALRDFENGAFPGSRQLTSGNDEGDRSDWLTPRSGWTGRQSDFPALDCYTEDGHLVIRAEVPGVDPSDVEVSVEEGRLHISGTKRHTRDKRDDDDRLFVTESYYGRFDRVVPLPEGVDTDEIKARHEDGVIEIRIPAERYLASRRRIPVQIEGKEQKQLEGKRSKKSETHAA